MKRSLSAVLIASLVPSPASAGQKPIKWQKVKKLSPGTEVVLTVAGGHPTKVRLLFADDVSLVTLKPTAPKLPKRVEEFLFGIGPVWPAIIDGGTYKPRGRSSCVLTRTLLGLRSRWMIPLVWACWTAAQTWANRASR